MARELPLLFLEGLLAFISPCMLPMLPVYLMYLAAGTEKGRRASVVNTIGFVAGFSVAFMAMGATATFIGAFLSGHPVMLRRMSGTVIALFGLHFLGFLKMPFLDAERKMSPAAGRGGVIGALLFGGAFSLGWTPCLGPFLASALLMAGNGKTLWQGVFCLFVFSMGLGIPYIISALLFTRIRGLFQWLRRNGAAIKRISGALLVAAGIAIATDHFAYWAALFG
ncbi:MAG: cytochrome c biogenesis protein CcdA [Synergistes sp.]|nr:cytochrome c biogenesis protein CcdA [Synergistes sp.]